MFQWLAIALLAVAASAAFIGADRVIESLQSDGEEETAQTSPAVPEAGAEAPAKRQAPAVVSFFNQLFDPEPEPTTPEPASGAESGEISQTAAPSTAAPATAAPTDPASAPVTAANGDLYGPPEPGSPAAMPPAVTQAVSQAQVPEAPTIAPASVGTDPPAPEASATTAGSPEASGEAAPGSSTPTASEPETPIPALW